MVTGRVETVLLRCYKYYYLLWSNPLLLVHLLLLLLLLSLLLSATTAVATTTLLALPIPQLQLLLYRHNCITTILLPLLIALLLQVLLLQLLLQELLLLPLLLPRCYHFYFIAATATHIYAHVIRRSAISSRLGSVHRSPTDGRARSYSRNSNKFL